MPGIALSRTNYYQLSAIMLGTTMLTIDISMVLFALPSIATGLGISMISVGWLVILFNTFGYCFMVLFGRLGDLLGRRRIFIYGCGIYVVFAFTAGLAPTYEVLMITRIFQGVAAGMIGANYPALITLSFPAQERGKAFGIAKTATALAAILSPIIGGELITMIGWRFVFFFSIPFGIGSIILCLYLVPESRGSQGEPIDRRGAILILAVFMPLALALSRAGAMGWTHPIILGLFAVSVAAGYIFNKHIRSAAFPLIDLALFRIPNFTASTLAGLFRAISHEIMYYVTPFVLIYYMGMVPSRAGLIMSLGAATSMMVLFYSGIISDRRGCTPLEVTGLVLTAGVFGFFALGSVSLSLEEIIIGLIVIGLGFGFFNTPNHSAVMGSVPKNQLGTAGGTYETFRVIGYFIGIPLVDLVMGKWAVRSRTVITARSGVGSPEFLQAIHYAYLVGLIAALLGLIFCINKFKHKSDPGF